MRALVLMAMLCGFGAGMIAFPILVVHLDWRGELVTLAALVMCIVGAIGTARLSKASAAGGRPPRE